MSLYRIDTIRTNNFSDPKVTEKIIQLWQNVTKKLHTEQTVIYGIYHDYDSNYKGNYSLTIATENTEDGEPFPDITQSDYKIFPVDTSQKNAVFSTWQQIWQLEEENNLNRAYAFDFEKYDTNGNVDIYISVNP